MQLKIQDKLFIKSTRDKAYGIISSPNSWPSFVDKIENINFVSDIYTGIIRMGSRKYEFIGKLVETGNPNKIELNIAFRDPVKKKDTLCAICYLIIESGDGVTVVENIQYKESINILLWLMIKFIGVFGRPVEKSNLENLRDLLENDGI